MLADVAAPPANEPVRCGFFGKVPARGDFVQRDLDPGFVDAWDEWLQGGLHGSREILGEAWLARYLESPIWHFAVGAGVCGDTAMAGVLIANVDKVGRYFPLTVAAPLPVGANLAAVKLRGLEWYANIEAIALTTLDDQFDFDAFVAAIASAGPPPQARSPTTGPWLAADVDTTEGLALLLAASAGAARGSLWWTDGSSNVPKALFTASGGLEPGWFHAMLDGDWEAHGWNRL